MDMEPDRGRSPVRLNGDGLRNFVSEGCIAQKGLITQTTMHNCLTATIALAGESEAMWKTW